MLSAAEIRQIAQLGEHEQTVPFGSLSSAQLTRATVVTDVDVDEVSEKQPPSKQAPLSP